MSWVYGNIKIMVMKTSKTLFKVAFRFFFTILTMLLTMQFISAQGWYDSDWQYRMPVTITNPGSSHLSGFQVQITLSSASIDFSKINTDGSDLRLTSDNGMTLIPFWLEDWDYTGQSASIWVKVPDIPVTGTTIYLYYGNTNATIEDPSYKPYYPFTSFTVTVAPVETPPAGPFTKHPDNPVSPIGRPLDIADDLLAENIVYDEVTGHYWMVLSNQTSGTSVCLIYSDDPANPDAWYWPQVLNQFDELVPADPVITQAIAPHLLKHNNTWYIFYGDRNTSHTSSNGSSGRPISVASSSSVSGPYTYIGEALPAGLTGTWESHRVDEPYVFQRTDGKWVMLYMAETGVLDEQIGYAVADNPAGPYTKYSGNPCLAFDGTSYDAGTIADPWAYEFRGTYYIGYTVSPTTSGWSTAIATTEDWTIFTKQGVILDKGSETNSFRGAVSRIGDQYVFPYTGNSYDICIATQPVYVTPAEPDDYYTDPADPLNTISNDPEAVFDFYDGFDSGSDPDPAKWAYASGNSALADVSGGLLTLTASSTYVRIDGTTSFGMDYIVETYARHPVMGANLITESGFVRAVMPTDLWINSLRITDNYTTVNRWQRYINSNGVNLPGTADDGWHKYSIYRESPGTAGFKIDDNDPVEVSSGIPTADMTPFLMSFGNTNVFLVDWTRVRKWAGGDPEVISGLEETDGTRTWTGAVSTDWHTPGNWSGGVPGESDGAYIPAAVALQPVISSSAECNFLTLESGATIELSGSNTLTLGGAWCNNGGSITVTGTGIINIPGSLINNSGTMALGAGALNVYGDIEIKGGTLSSGTGSITINGDWKNSGGTFIPGTGTVTFSGMAQTIGGSVSTDFNNLTIGSSGITTLELNTRVAGDLSLVSGVFDLAGFSCNRITLGGTLMVANQSELMIGGTGSLPSNFSYVSLGSSSVVEYYGSTQTVAALSGLQTYGNIVLSGGGARLVSANITATGNLSVSSGVLVTLATGTISTVGSLILGGAPALAGSYGSSTSSAVNKNDTYFTAFNDGIIIHSVLEAGSWMGGTSSDWHTDSNWVGGVPDENTDVIISGYAPFQPQIASGMPTAVCRDLTINTNGSLTVGAGVALTVEGDLSNSGTLTIESGVLSNGSLIVNGTSTGNLTYNRQLNTSNNLYHYFSSPLITSSFPTTGTVWTYYEPTGTWDATTECISGRGYAIQHGIDMLSFTGTMVNSANTVVNVTSPYTDEITSTDDYDDRTFVSGRNPAISGGIYGGGGWNLLGNPFTSAMRVDEFITANTSQFDPYYVALYIFDGTNYRYIANSTGWPNASEMDVDHIQAGQGFFVLAMNNTSSFTFSRDMQEHATNVLLLKSSAAEERWPGLLLKVSAGSFESQTSIVYNSEMNTGLDPGYDVGQFSTGGEVNIYTKIVQAESSVKLARQALPTTDTENIAVPVGVDSENGGEVTFSAITVPLGTRKFWLEDRASGIFTDLTLKSYTVNLPSKTAGTGRFYIIASTNTPTGIENPDGESGLQIWAAGSKVIIKGPVEEGAYCEIFNLRGNRVIKRQLVDSELNTINLPSGVHGILVVRIDDRGKSTTKKITVF